MSRECNQCGSDSPPGSRFCMNCGTPLIKKQVRKNTSAAGWWSSQNNGVKALTLVGACCVGMIVLVGIIGLISPDASTSSYPGSSYSSYDYSSDYSSSGSDDSLRNFYYDHQSGISTANADCPYCGGTLDLLSDGSSSLIVCRDCDAYYYD